MNDTVGAFLAVVILWALVRLFAGRDQRGAGSRQVNQNMVRLAALKAAGADLVQVEAVQAMFPHIPEASIRYDLQRSGSAEATCDRILQQGYLPPVRARRGGARMCRFTDGSQPPPEFGGVPAVQAASAAAPAPAAPAASASAAPAPAKPAPSLIARYHLEDRLASESGEGASDAPLCKGKKADTGAAWVANTEEREHGLRERKAQMIMAARRRMLEREKGGATEKSSAAPGEAAP